MMDNDWPISVRNVDYNLRTRDVWRSTRGYTAESQRWV